MKAEEILKERRAAWQKIIDRYKHLPMSNPMVKSLRGLAMEVESLDTELRRAYTMLNNQQASREKIIKAKVDMRVAEVLKGFSI